MSIEDILIEAVNYARQTTRIIDITDDIIFLTNLTGYDDYTRITIDGVIVLDRYGLNIETYNLSKLTRGTGILAKVEENGTLIIEIHANTDLTLLEEAINGNYERVHILCNNICIPPIFSNMITNEIFLKQPMIDDRLLANIPCDIVSIYTDIYCSSYYPLSCRKFTLEYLPNMYLADSDFPAIPRKCRELYIEPISNDKEELVLNGNDTLEKLTIVTSDNGDAKFVHLCNMPSLVSLETCSSVKLDEMYQLIELRCVDQEVLLPVAFIDDKIMLDSMLESNITVPLSNLLIFEGIVDNIALMPNLRELTTTMVIENHLIPRGLKKYMLYSDNLDFTDADRLERLQLHLLTMPSIKRMPLYIINQSYPIHRRPDVYYDIYSPGTSRFRYMDDESNDPMVIEALLSNQRYRARNRKLRDIASE